MFGRRDQRLYWSSYGEVLCSRHQPPSDFNTWMLEEWEEVPDLALQIRTLSCESCGFTPSDVPKAGAPVR